MEIEDEAPRGPKKKGPKMVYRFRLTVRCKKCKKYLIKPQFRVKGHSKVKID